MKKIAVLFLLGAAVFTALFAKTAEGYWAAQDQTSHYYQNDPVWPDERT